MLKRILLRVALLWCAAGFTLGTATAAPLSLSDFISALDAYPDLALAQGDLDYARARAERDEADTGLRAFGTVSTGNSYEPQFAGGVREYGSIVGNAGLRYPVLGTAGDERRRVGASRIDALVSEAQSVLVRERSHQVLRAAFYEYASNQEQLALAALFLADAEHIERVLAQRADAKLLLEGDRLDLVAGFAQARRLQARLAATQQRLAATLARVRPDFDGRLRFAPMSAQTPDTALQTLDEVRTRLVRETDALRETEFASGVRGNVFVSGQLRHDTDLGNARSVNAGIAIDLPVAPSKAGRSTRAEMLARNKRALAQLDSAYYELERLANQVRSDGAQAPLVSAREAAVASAGVLREAALRAELSGGMPGDPIERWVRTRKRHFDTLVELLVAETQQLASAPNPGREPTPLCALPGVGFLAWSALQAQAGAACNVDVSRGVRHAVYAWSGMRVVEQGGLRGDALDVSDIWLSFSASELAQLDKGNTRGALRKWIESQHAQGRRVALLLGDPQWLGPDGGRRLARVVDRFSGLPFDAIHLDLEPDQIPAAVRPGRQRDRAWQALAARLDETKQRTGRPVIASIHWRALTPDAAGNCEACAAAAHADEVAVMLYSTSTASVRQRIAAIAAALPGRPLWLAQSIEAELGPEESWHGAGRDRMLAALRELAPLIEAGTLRGFAIQSLEEYMGAPE